MIVTIAAAILLIIILVSVHELGHLLAARACGVGVEQFSIGFGPGFVLFRTKHFPVYLRCGLLGGFIRIKERDRKEQSHLTITGKYIEDISLLKRILIYVAGVGFNLILAVIILTIMYLFIPQGTQIEFGTTQAFTFNPISHWYLAPIGAIVVSAILFFKLFVAIFIVIQKLVIAIISLTAIPGVGIVGAFAGLGGSIHSGVWTYIWVIYIASIFLAAFNILPFMPFDGGRISLDIFQRILGESIIFKVVKFVHYFIGIGIIGILVIHIIMSDMLNAYSAVLLLSIGVLLFLKYLLSKIGKKKE